MFVTPNGKFNRNSTLKEWWSVIPNDQSISRLDKWTTKKWVQKEETAKTWVERLRFTWPASSKAYNANCVELHGGQPVQVESYERIWWRIQGLWSGGMGKEGTVCGIWNEKEWEEWTTQCMRDRGLKDKVMFWLFVPRVSPCRALVWLDGDNRVTI